MISCPDARRTIQTVESVHHHNNSLNSQFFIKLTVPLFSKTYPYYIKLDNFVRLSHYMIFRVIVCTRSDTQGRYYVGKIFGRIGI